MTDERVAYTAIVGLGYALAALAAGFLLHLGWNLL